MTNLTFKLSLKSQREHTATNDKSIALVGFEIVTHLQKHLDKSTNGMLENNFLEVEGNESLDVPWSLRDYCKGFAGFA